MGLIIAVLSQKGGPGKSTISRAIATCYASFDWSVKIGDLDLNQSTSFTWLQRRLNNKIEPVVSVEAFGSATSALKQAQNYDIFILDGAPTSSRDTLDASKSADLIVLPTGPSIDDLEPAVKLAHQLKKSGIDENRICFVLSKMSDSQAELQESKYFLSQTPYKIIGGHIEAKRCYSNAMNTGHSITETKFQKPREKAEEVIQSIINTLEALEG